MNHYATAISILEKTLVDNINGNWSAKRLLFEVARNNPGVLVKANERLQKTNRPSIDKQIIEFAKTSKGKIDTIKYCRNITGEGLKESKEHVERLNIEWPSVLSKR